MTVQRRPEAVRLESVTKTYETAGGRVTALDEVTVDVPAGGFTVVMGPSGSGKSTFLQCAAGLDLPTRGRVSIDGSEVTGGNETALTKFRRQRVGFVFQQFNLLPTLDVLQNVMLPLRLAGRKADRQRCVEGSIEVTASGVTSTRIVRPVTGHVDATLAGWPRIGGNSSVSAAQNVNSSRSSTTNRCRVSRWVRPNPSSRPWSSQSVPGCARSQAASRSSGTPASAARRDSGTGSARSCGGREEPSSFAPWSSRGPWKTSHSAA
ncbi:MAG: ATP-binding cassette domain-containing protein [Streptosporangiales bacterium]|nr:ATP-binding cassette domain-containing protein [Streptosporangiales bacterium]